MAEQMYPLRPGNQTGRRAPNFGGRSGTGGALAAPASAAQAAAPVTALGGIGSGAPETGDRGGMAPPDFDVGRAGMPFGEFLSNTLTGMAVPASFGGFVGGQMARGAIDAARGRQSPFSFAGPMSRATYDAAFGGGPGAASEAAASNTASTAPAGSPEQPSFANQEVVSTAIGGPPGEYSDAHETSFANQEVVSTAIGGPPGEYSDAHETSDGGGGSADAGGAENNTGESSSFRHGGPIPMDDDLDLEAVDITAHEGEFVLRPEAVEAYGQDVIAALNEMRIPPEVLHQILALMGGGEPAGGPEMVEDGGMARRGGMVRPSPNRGPRFGKENFAGRARPPGMYKTALRHL